MGAPTILIFIPARHGSDWALHLMSHLGGHPDPDRPSEWHANMRDGYLSLRLYPEWEQEDELEQIQEILQKNVTASTSFDVGKAYLVS